MILESTTRMPDVTAVKRPIDEQIRDLVSDIPGWTPEDQLFAIFMLASTTSHLDGEIWEIGAWCGRSTTVLALAARQSRPTMVRSIDLFPDRSDWFRNTDGTFSFKVVLNGKTYYSYRDQTVWAEPFEKEVDSMYQQHGDCLQKIFTRIIGEKGFSDLVSAFRGTPQDMARDYSGSIRFAFVDGDHGYEAVCNDIRTVEKFLLPGGWIAFDDAFTTYEGAVNGAAAALFLTEAVVFAVVVVLYKERSGSRYRDILLTRAGDWIAPESLLYRRGPSEGSSSP